MAGLLREAVGEGRLDRTYAARSHGDLVALTADLPAAAQAGQALQPRSAARPPIPARTCSTSFALMSETRRSGVWEVGATHTG